MLHVEINDEVAPFVEAEMERNGFATPGDYVNKLLQVEEARLAEEEKLDGLLQEGLDSGFVQMNVAESMRWIAEAEQRYEARSRTGP